MWSLITLQDRVRMLFKNLNLFRIYTKIIRHSRVLNLLKRLTARPGPCPFAYLTKTLHFMQKGHFHYTGFNYVPTQQCFEADHFFNPLLTTKVQSNEATLKRKKATPPRLITWKRSNERSKKTWFLFL